ncbi:MAG: phosphoesterase PA-phosphatase related protein [uncultured bacterium]|nr:MAG: phosphoesterase PA-phosphatase related protein [uncultured bacterium]
MHNIEKEIVVYLNKSRSKKLDVLSEFISSVKVLFIGWVIFIAIMTFLNFQDGLKMFFELALVFIIHYFFSELIIKYGSKKILLIRKRPYVQYPNEIRGIGRNFSDSSFPSSHMASVTGGLIVLNSFFPLFWPIFIFFALMLGISRLYNGMHYPSDIIAGAILGFIYGFTTLSIYPNLVVLIGSIFA